MKTVTLTFNQDELATICNGLYENMNLPNSTVIKKRSGKLLDKINKARDKKPIKVSSRKAKGRDLQKAVCADIAELFNVPYDQQDDQCFIHSREMGQNGVDIVLRGEIAQRFPYAIECKATEQISLSAFVTQARNNLKDCQEWLLIIKNKTFKKPIVVMEWSHFIDICRLRLGNKK